MWTSPLLRTPPAYALYAPRVQGFLIEEIQRSLLPPLPSTAGDKRAWQDFQGRRRLTGTGGSTVVTIGTDLQTGENVEIGDIERRSGLYILGKSGMGKSTLLVNLMHD